MENNLERKDKDMSEKKVKGNQKGKLEPEIRYNFGRCVK